MARRATTGDWFWILMDYFLLFEIRRSRPQFPNKRAALSAGRTARDSYMQEVNFNGLP